MKRNGIGNCSQSMGNRKTKESKNEANIQKQDIRKILIKVE